ncbi:glycosyltransferase family 2 protein [bacterium]|nr:MAG: glycosyltransferase family 2 protein [bacterium]
MLSVLIVNWNTRDLLRACLASLQAHPFSGGQELIVVDNDSVDGSAAMVRSEFPDVRLIANAANRGYAAGNNDAFEVARGDWLLTLNPDTEVGADTLDRAIEALSRFPERAATGVRQVGNDGDTQRSVRAFPTPLNIGMASIGLGAHYRLDGFDYTKEGDAPQPMGTFLLFRRAALRDLGDDRRPFDEHFPIFFNEVDLLYRLKKAGWPAMYTPAAEILHHGGESTRQVRPAMIWESHLSLLRYLRKHGGTFYRTLGFLLFAPLVLAAAFVRARGYHAGFRP